MSIRFAAAGFAHYHIYNQTEALLGAGAEMACFLDDGSEGASLFAQRYPQIRSVLTLAEILQDETIHLVVSAAVPDERAPLGIAAMQHGKHFLCTKPGFATLAQLEQARQTQAETGRRYGVYFGEHFGNGATVRAGELVHGGAIGQVVQTVGFGPHKLGQVKRPPWTFQRPRFGGILNDLASHQIDQFLFFTGARDAQIVAARTANVAHPQHTDFEDFGEVLLQSGQASGYIRVDWLTPVGLPTWGDVRLFIQGTEGTIELRKNCDIAGRPGENHLFLVDREGVHYMDCSNQPLPFGAQWISDLLDGTETAVTQAHTFTVSELALQAQNSALSRNEAALKASAEDQ